GIGKPVTEHVVKITKDEIPLAIYDTKGLELNKETQLAAKNEIMQIISNGFLGDRKDEIHIVYYCINGLSGRIEDDEIELINTIGEHLPV
ncbi:MAG: GTPase, partial [Neofamilia sp.]